MPLREAPFFQAAYFSFHLLVFGSAYYAWRVKEFFYLLVFVKLFPSARIPLPFQSTWLQLANGERMNHDFENGANCQANYFSRFGIDERIIREAIAAALSQGGDWADLYFQHSKNNYLALEDGEVNRAYCQTALGVGIRVLQGNQTGYAYTEDLRRGSIINAAKTAAAIANGPARATPTSYRTTPLANHYSMRVPWEGIEPKEKLPILYQINTGAFQADPRIEKVSIALGDQISFILFADSEGRIVEDTQPMTDLRVSCVAQHQGRRESNGYSCSGRAGFEFYTPQRIENVLKQAISRTLILFDSFTPPAGEMPVVLAAGSSGILLHEAIGHGMEADFARKNISIYADKVGKTIAKPFVNVVDDGTLPGSRGSINVDDEGVLGQKTMLVENGVFTSFLHDRISAKHFGVAPTGNGRRENYAFAPIPRMRTTYLLPGPHAHEEIIASVKKGIYCENFTNGQVQIGAGDFTFYVKNGHLIENGKLTRPIKDVNVIGNGPKVLENVDMVADNLVLDDFAGSCGKDGQMVPVSLGLPTVRVPSMTVGGKQA